MPTALHVPGLTDTQKLVLLSLTEHANADHGNSTFVGQGRIAVEIGKGRSSVNRAMHALENAGYITREANYRKTDDGRAYRSSDTTVVHYAAMQAAIDSEGVENVESETPSDTPDLTPPSALTALPLVTSEHGGSALTALGVVLPEHGGSAVAAQQNREPNRELNRESDRECETGTPPIAPTASGGRPSPQAMHQLPQQIQEDAIECIQQMAVGEQDAEDLYHCIAEYVDGAVLDALDTWQVPAQAAKDYHARKWFGRFMNTMRRDGHYHHEETAA